MHQLKKLECELIEANKLVNTRAQEKFFRT